MGKKALKTVHIADVIVLLTADMGSNPGQDNYCLSSPLLPRVSRLYPIKATNNQKEIFRNCTRHLAHLMMLSESNSYPVVLYIIYSFTRGNDRSSSSSWTSKGTSQRFFVDADMQIWITFTNNNHRLKFLLYIFSKLKQC